MRYLLISLLLVGCGRTVTPLPPPVQRVLLQSELASAQGKIPNHTAGWPSDVDCDGALWAGEARSAGVARVDISAALQDDGRPTRKPHEDCGPGESFATSSTDMQLGIIEGLLAAHDVDGLVRLQDYADSHGDWVGEPHDTDHLPYLLMKPGTRTLLARAIRKLGGKSSGVWADIPLINSPPGTDFEVHIQVVALAIERQCGYWTPDDAVASSLLASGNPSDAAVQAIAGNTPAAEALILNPKWTAPGYVRGAPGYDSVHRAWILHFLVTGGHIDG